MLICNYDHKVYNSLSFVLWLSMISVHPLTNSLVSLCFTRAVYRVIIVVVVFIVVYNGFHYASV